MDELTITPKQLKNHTLILDETLPGDKSISHRAYILASLCNNNSLFENMSEATDCKNSRQALKSLGIPIKNIKKKTAIHGQGLKGLKPPPSCINVGNAGTAIRLLTGILAAQPFNSEISGDKSIQQRPMDRIINPLGQMGAIIKGKARNNKRFAPLNIIGQKQLKGILYQLPIASAQVKSALLFAGLYAQEKTVIIEETPSRDHSERLLRYFGADILCKKNHISITNTKPLNNPHPNTALFIPNDPSAAAFFIVLAACHPSCTLILRKVSLNPQRIAFLDILKHMGLNYHIENKIETWEPYGDIIVNSSELKNISIPKEIIPQIIDEIPILAIAGCFARGTFAITDAKELRVKESDRIHNMVCLLSNMGIDVTEKEDGFSFKGPVKITPFHCDSQHDHRIAMSAIIAAQAGQVSATIKDCNCIKTSFPKFFDSLEKILINN
ncbi:MAG: 3-phosphoshikimate 1-carboxyvinyltransferase [bacterium]